MIKPRFDVHAHFLNLAGVPDDLTRELSGLPESFANNWLTRNLIKAFTRIISDKPAQFLELHRKDICEIARTYFDQNLIDIAVPLVLDLEYASETREGVKPFKEQVEEMSIQAANYPWQLFPFVMFHPAREEALDIVKNAIKYQGFIGVKLYPSLGYSVSVSGHRNRDPTKMRQLFRFCELNHVPITIHCSPKGAYKIGNKEMRALSNPAEMMQALTEYALRVNFAHFGGDISDPEAKAWREQIVDYMAADLPSRVYADLSYSREEDITSLMEREPTKERLLFGTDWSLITHSQSLSEYLQMFELLRPEAKDLLMTHNPAYFLFGEQLEIPEGYERFLRTRNPDALNRLPYWLEKKG